MMKNRKQKNTVRREIPVLAADPETGLTQQQAAERAVTGGEGTGAGRTAGEIIAGNLFTFFNLIFVVLGVLLAVSGSSVKNMGFLLVAACNAVIGCVQELRAKRAVDRLTLVAERPVEVIREGKTVSLPPRQLVRDDIAVFSAGQQLCADGIVRSGSLQVDESLLTGESVPVEKNAGDRVLSGSVVMAGRGRVQLTAVGRDAFAAGLAREAKANPAAKKSEMMRSLDRLIRIVGILLIPVGLVLFRQEYEVLRLSFRDSVESTVAALVGMIPEGLYLLTSIAMAASALKLAGKRVLVQEMNCIEALARVDVLCVDKTGTITEPEMDVERVIPLDGTSREHLEAVLTAFYGDTEPENETGRAIASYFAGSSPWKCTKRLPFSPETRFSGVSFREEGTFLLGAPAMLPEARVEKWMDAGYRVLLAAAYDGELPDGLPVPERVRPLGLVLLRARLRPAAQETFAYFAAQGVSVRVISGDDPRTVSRVALQAGIAGAERFVDASQLKTEEEIAAAAADAVVFGRVSPRQKRQIIRALQQRGHTVAMTGDGVNDLLAMRQADCSIAMASGAQAASKLAGIVMLDSDFAAMPGIVAEGRRVINNIQRAAALFLVKNIFSLGLSLLSLVTGEPYPLEPIHLTLIAALTIGTPSFFLAMEPNYRRVEGHFLRGVLRRALPGGLTNLLVVLMAQQLAAQGVKTLCAGVLAVVGLLVLLRVCRPFNPFRALIWGAMAAGLTVSFALLGPLFELQVGALPPLPVSAGVLAGAVVTYIVLQWLFDRKRTTGVILC